jgi:hypothetical protein
MFKLCDLFVNISEAQKSIPPGWESIPGLLKRFTNTGSALQVIFAITNYSTVYLLSGHDNEINYSFLGLVTRYNFLKYISRYISKNY